MFDDPHKRTFFSAPQSVQSLIAAFLEPGITVLTFVVATLAYGERDGPPCADALPARLRAHLPGPQPLPRAAAGRRGRHRLVVDRAARDPGAVRATRRAASTTSRTTSCWPGRCVTPVLQWLATWIGRTIVRRHAASARVAPHRRRRRRERAGREGRRALQGGNSGGRRLRRLLRRPQRRAHRRTRPSRSCWARLPTSRAYVARARHPRGLHHPAARLAAAHRRAARAAAGHDRIALLRARRVRHQHHPGPAAGHERRAGGGHLRDAVHRHQRARQARSATSCSPAHPRPDLAAAAGDRHRRQAQLAGPGALQAAPQRPRRRRDHRLQVPLDADAGRRRRSFARRPATTRASRRSARSCAAPRSTSCRSSSTCCRAR